MVVRVKQITMVTKSDAVVRAEGAQLAAGSCRRRGAELERKSAARDCELKPRLASREHAKDLIYRGQMNSEKSSHTCLPTAAHAKLLSAACR